MTLNLSACARKSRCSVMSKQQNTSNKSFFRLYTASLVTWHHLWILSIARSEYIFEWNIKQAYTHFLTHGCLSGNYSLYSSLFLTNDRTLSVVEFQVLQLHSWSAVCVADKDQIPDLQRLLSSKPKVLSEFCVAT